LNGNYIIKIKTDTNKKVGRKGVKEAVVENQKFS